VVFRRQLSGEQHFHPHSRVPFSLFRERRVQYSSTATRYVCNSWL
jgi:hypothetical protein